MLAEVNAIGSLQCFANSIINLLSGIRIPIDVVFGLSSFGKISFRSKTNVTGPGKR